MMLNGPSFVFLNDPLLTLLALPPQLLLFSIFMGAKYKSLAKCYCNITVQINAVPRLNSGTKPCKILQHIPEIHVGV